MLQSFAQLPYTVLLAFLDFCRWENDNNIPGPWNLGKYTVAILKQAEARQAEAEKVGRGCIRPSPGPQGKM